MREWSIIRLYRDSPTFKWAARFFIGGIIFAFVIGLIFFLLQKLLDDSDREFFKNESLKTQDLCAKNLDLLKNLTISSEEYTCPEQVQKNENCLNNVTIIPVNVRGDDSHAVLIDSCDFIYTREPQNFKTGKGFIYMIVNPRWEDNHKHVLASFSDKMVLYVEDNLLKLKIVELDGNEYVLVDDSPKNWNVDEWYAIIALLDITHNQIKLYVDGILKSSLTLDKINIQTENLIGYMGTDSNGKFQADAAFNYISFSNIPLDNFPAANPPKNEIYCENTTYVNITSKMDGVNRTSLIVDQCGRTFNNKINFKEGGGAIIAQINPRWNDSSVHVLYSLSDKIILYIEDNVLKLKVVEDDRVEHILVANQTDSWNKDEWYEIIAAFEIIQGNIHLAVDRMEVANSTISNIQLNLTNLTLYIGVDSNNKYLADAGIALSFIHTYIDS